MHDNLANDSILYIKFNEILTHSMVVNHTRIIKVLEDEDHKIRKIIIFWKSHSLLRENILFKE